jgi:dipeptidyl aminopeptidase
VQDNDLFVLGLPAARDVPVRITKTGSKTVFNGVPDWVYEEEVFSADKAFWFSPDSKYLAFLSFDETAVEEYTFPVYNPDLNSEKFLPYTTFVRLLPPFLSIR